MGKSRRLSIPVGSVYGRWTVLEMLERQKGKPSKLVCRCSCGVVKTLSQGSVVRAGTLSCGCYSREVASKTCKNFATHGMTRTPEYRAWEGLKRRCLSVNANNYYLYGARGIGVCQSWVSSFENFLSDMGLRPSPRHTVDRIDNSKGYCPNNCRWATKKEQSRNTRANLWVTYKGNRILLLEAAALSGINYFTLYSRLERGTPETELFDPIKQRNKRQDRDFKLPTTKRE